MENFVRILNNNPLKTQLINQDQSQQGLQFLLNSNESIIVKTNAISYFSPGLQENYVHERSLLEELVEKSSNTETKTSDEENSEEFKQVKISSSFEIKYRDFLKLSNRNNDVKYIGIASTGKIMIINPMLYDNLVVDLKSVIAFNNKVGLYNSPTSISKVRFLGLRSYDYVRVGLKGGSEDNSYIFGKNILSESSINSKLYLQSNGKLKIINYLILDLLIEKRLGRDETIIVNHNGIVAFENSIIFENINETNFKFITKKNNFLKATGPGLIIFSMTKTSCLNKTRDYSRLISFLWFVFSIVLLVLTKTYLKDEHHIK